MKTTRMRLVALFAGAAIFAAACGGSTTTPAPSTAPTQAPAASEAPGSEAPSSEAPASEAPSAEPLSGELTLWHSYGSGGGETSAFLKAIGNVLVANKDLTIHPVEQPFSDIFTKWQTDVLAGEDSPDMFIAPNDHLFEQADVEALANLDTQLAGKLEGFDPVSVEGSKVAGSFFMVPESLKAVALWYDKSKVATAPTTTDELLAAVQGGMTLGLNQNAYHMFGFTGAFGGTLMDDTGKCIADQGGFAEAFKYMQDLKAAGAKYYVNGNDLKQDFQTGKLAAVIDGPWQTGDFTKAIGDNLAVAPMPAGSAKANPFTGTDGWYINPNSPNVDLAVKFALQMVTGEQEQTLVNDAGHVPAAPGMTINNEIVKGFAEAAASGLARPQSKEFATGYWTPFGNAINELIDKNADATQTVATACASMNEINGK